MEKVKHKKSMIQNQYKNNYRMITQLESQLILDSQEFVEQFKRMGRRMEYQLNDENNDDDLEKLINQDCGINEMEEQKLIHNIDAIDQICQNRVVNYIYPVPNTEQFISSYSTNPLGHINDPTGLLLVWSVKSVAKIEHILTCHSSITSCAVSPFDPHLIIGGLYSGQVVLWDSRAKQTPFLKSTLQNGGHAYPIYTVNYLANQQQQIVTCCSEGKVCLWNINMLNQPFQTFDLQSKSLQVNTTCAVVGEGDQEGMFLGTENGMIHMIDQLENEQSKEKICNTYESHYGPISSLSYSHTYSSSIQHSKDLLLSSSFDLSINLWSPKLCNEPLTRFESAEDYIFDVQWNPVCPYVFGSVDGEGFIDIWALDNIEEPKIRHQLEDKVALNKIRWNKEGNKIFVGDAVGKVSILDMDKNLMTGREEKVEQVLSSLVKNGMEKEGDSDQD